MNDESSVKSASRRLYCDHAATSFPKPAEVLQAMVEYATGIGASAGRGGYAEAREAAGVLKTCRERLNQLFNGESAEHFAFGMNCTDGLNMGIRGVLGGVKGEDGGGHVVTTVLDHNSVLRPLHALGVERGVTVTHVGVDPKSGSVDPAEIRKAIRKETKLIAVVHGSNVTGAVQPIGEIGKIAREAGIPFFVDGAQTAGHVPIDVQKDCIDLLAFPGHKGLLGPLGTGGLYVRPGMEGRMVSMRQGGTGSASEEAMQPEFMPDKFESGSHNGIGIAGLSAGVEWILRRGVQEIFEHDQMLCRAFMEGVEGVEGLRFFGPQGIRGRMGVFSLRVEGMGAAEVAERLEREFGVLSRAGLHCAPLAHGAIGTVAEGGTVRVSFGPFLTVLDVKYVADALAAIAWGVRAGQGT